VVAMPKHKKLGNKPRHIIAPQFIFTLHFSLILSTIFKELYVHERTVAGHSLCDIMMTFTHRGGKAEGQGQGEAVYSK